MLHPQGSSHRRSQPSSVGASGRPACDLTAVPVRRGLPALVGYAKQSTRRRRKQLYILKRHQSVLLHKKFGAKSVSIHQYQATKYFYPRKQIFKHVYVGWVMSCPGATLSRTTNFLLIYSRLASLYSSARTRYRTSCPKTSPQCQVSPST